MRVYVAATPQTLAGALSGSEPLTLPPTLPRDLPAHAVTPALWAQVRGHDPACDQEDAEYAALLDAARSSLLLLADEAGTGAVRPRRLVLAADVADADMADMADMADDADAAARTPPGEAASAVRLTGPLGLADVVSAHVDEAAATALVRRAVAALRADPAADPAAQEALDAAVDDAEECDLLWYDASELADLAAELTSGG